MVEVGHHKPDSSLGAVRTQRPVVAAHTLLEEVGL